MENQLARLFILFACVLPFSCLSQHKAENRYSVTGNIKGLGNDSVTISITNYDKEGNRQEPETYTTKAQNDKFLFKGKVVGTKNASAILAGIKSRKYFNFYIEKGAITINGNINDPDGISVTGTPANNDRTKTRKYTHAIYNRILPLREKIKTANTESDEYKFIAASIQAKYDSIQSYELAFIKSNPDSYMSAILLWVKQDKLLLDELEKLYNSFSMPVQNSSNGIEIKKKIEARKFVAIGNPAPDFTTTDTSGNTVKLSDFKGKYVLLEFWANWCVPCRAQSPHLAEMYKKYNNKGFTILNYSIDDENAAEKWKAAIVKDKLTWTQTSDLAGFNSKVSKLYGVQPIPDNFLIDPKGIIIGRRLQGKELEEKLENLLE